MFGCNFYLLCNIPCTHLQINNSEKSKRKEKRNEKKKTKRKKKNI